MARIRSIKPEIRSSEKVNSWPVAVRYFWIMLWGYCDDHGRGRDNAKLIVADAYPLDDDVSPEMVESWLVLLAHDGVIRRYEVDGNRYLMVLNWSEHQKPAHPAKSVIPEPDPHNSASGEDCGNLPQSSVNGSPEQRAESREQRAESRGAESSAGHAGTRIPANFTADAFMIRWAQDNAPNVNVKLATQKFKSHYRSVAGKAQFRTDWTAAWESWLLSDQQRAEDKPQQFKTAAEKNLEAGAKLHQIYTTQQDQQALEGTS